jgi:Transglutaminase-like superfamily
MWYIWVMDNDNTPLFRRQDMTQKQRWLMRLVAVVLLAAPVVWAAQEKAAPKYMALLLNGKKSGYMVESREVEADVVTTSTATHIVMARGGMRLEMTVKQAMKETIDGKPLSFRSESKGMGQNRVIVGKVTPHGKVEITITSMGKEQKMTRNWPAGAVMAEGDRLARTESGLKKGMTYSHAIYDPDSLRAIPTKSRVGGKAKVDLFGRIVELTEVETTMTVGGSRIVAKNYTDGSHEVQKSVTSLMGMQMIMIACSKYVAMQPAEPMDIMKLSMLSSPRAISKRERKKPLRFTFTPKKAGDMVEIASSSEQAVANGLAVTVRKLTPPKGVALQYKGKDRDALAALKPSRWVESDDKTVQNLARLAIGNTTDAAKAARKIQDFTAKYISAKNLSVGYATAAEVAKSRMGDCTEHAVFAAALCQAAGIPARVAVGLGYTEKFAGKRNVFVPHAWFQVYLDGKWYSYDAALKQFDTAHIYMGHGDGDPFEFFGLMDTMSKVKIAKVERAK